MTEIIFERKVAEEIIIEKACSVLEHGGIIVLPTDTIPGIGCRADDHDAVERLFELKQRPLTLPVPVILADTEATRLYTKNVPPSFDNLAKKYWPGALTIILQSNGTIDSLVGGGSNTIGFRIPDSLLVRSIVRCLKSPLALTSANPHNVRPSAMHDRLLAWWKNEVDLIILGRMTVPRPASAVINLTVDPPQILREGTIDSNEIMSVALGKEIESS
jgi:tRNA threonylcarbamoyl adenosine modification protein (Sua5/YciO/YrdC/YwlC family)